MNARCIPAAGAVLGEGLAWDPRNGALLFVDITGQRLHRLLLDNGAQQSWETEEPIYGIIPRGRTRGGDRLDRLFVTSAAFGRRNERLAGGVFELDPGVPRRACFRPRGLT